MRISDMTWLEVEEYLRTDDRAVLPLGSTEQHAYLSLATDVILAERVAHEAAEPLGVPVFPGLPYGLSPYFMGYPGTITLDFGTYSDLLRDILDSLYQHGFRRILIVNGHGGNSPVARIAHEWERERDGARVRFHDWWKAPRTWAKVQEIDPEGSHANWMESFPWTRVASARPPEEPKPVPDLSSGRELGPTHFRELLGDGSFGGRYQRPDGDMTALWTEAVQETRDLLGGDW